jgi:hypothetical protein
MVELVVVMEVMVVVVEESSHSVLVSGNVALKVVDITLDLRRGL